MIVLLNGMPLSVDNESHQQGEGRLSVEGMMVAGRKAVETRTAKAGRDPVTEQGQRHRESQSLTRDRGTEKCRWRQSQRALLPVSFYS